MNVNVRTNTMSRDDVVRAERRAWVFSQDEGGREYFFDGINFWHRRGRSEAQPTAAWRTPRGGWRHRETCGCERCAA
jgi:hypothetical protein